MGRLCRQPAWGLLGWLLFHSRSTGVVSRRRQDSPRSPQDTPYPGPDSPPRSHWPLVRPPPRAPRTRVFTVGPPIPAPRRVTNFVPSSAGAIGAKLVRPRPLPTCRSGRRAAPRRAARSGRGRGEPRTARPGRTGESPQSPRSLRLRGRGREGSAARGGGGAGTSRSYLRGRRATVARPRGCCAAARRARSGGEQATTNGDISRRSTWRASEPSAGRPQAPRSSASPLRSGVTWARERARCSHPASVQLPLCLRPTLSAARVGPGGLLGIPSRPHVRCPLLGPRRCLVPLASVPPSPGLEVRRRARRAGPRRVVVARS